MSSHEMPTQIDMMWPTLKALEKNGGSASITEIVENLAEIMKASNEILETPHTDGRRSKFEYNSAWARTRLKHLEMVENSARGVWAINEKGRNIKSDQEIRNLVKDYKYHKRLGVVRDFREPIGRDADKRLFSTTEQPTSATTGSIDTVDTDIIENEHNWDEKLLDILCNEIAPDAFERLCQRLLRESGFIKVEVTGRSSDGGIDGVGILRVNLLSFHVIFQSKCYSGPVGAGAIRDFRGAMVGRTDKGLFITTGQFTRDARKEAIRDGAPAIDLIDGNELCQLLKKLELGVRTETVERVEIDKSFFENM